MGYFNNLGRHFARAVSMLTLLCFATTPVLAKSEAAQKSSSRASMSDAWSKHKQTNKKKPPRKPKYVAKARPAPKAKRHARPPAPQKKAAKAKRSGKPPAKHAKYKPAAFKGKGKAVAAGKGKGKGKGKPKAVAAAKAKSKPKHK